MAITITVDQFSKTLRHAFLPSIQKALVAGLQDGGKIIERTTKRTIEKEDLIYRGELIDSVSTERVFDGAIVRVEAPHARWLEYGTRPFTPPLAPLKWWALNKLGVDDTEAESIAFGIQQKYRREGIKPRFFFRRSVDKSFPKIKNRLEIRVMRAEHRLFRRIGKAVLR
jgi:hypothetical protein